MYIYYFPEPFPEYGIVIIVLGSLLLIVMVAAFLIYRYVSIHYLHITHCIKVISTHYICNVCMLGLNITQTHQIRSNRDSETKEHVRTQ